MSIQHSKPSSNILEVLEKILDKGVVVAGDIKISLADVDLLTIKIRLLVASVDKAREIGLNWWENDPYYSSKATLLQEENRKLTERIEKLERLVDTDRQMLPPASLPVKEEGTREPSTVQKERMEIPELPTKDDGGIDEIPKEKGTTMESWVAQDESDEFQVREIKEDSLFFQDEAKPKPNKKSKWHGK